MRPDFSKAVDPVFLYVLELLERVKSSDAPDWADERTRILGRLDHAEVILGQTDEWKLAKYALIAWVDEMLTEPVWDGAAKWRDNSLEFEAFGSAVRFTEFYVRGESAARLPKKDALEVFYLCVVLGFRGMYRNPEMAERGRQQVDVELPDTLEKWAKRYSEIVKSADDLSEPVGPTERIRGAPWREGKFLFLGSWLTAAFLAVLIATLHFVLKPS